MSDMAENMAKGHRVGREGGQGRWVGPSMGQETVGRGKEARDRDQGRI
jgi:hypothetical protein